MKPGGVAIEAGRSPHLHTASEARASKERRDCGHREGKVTAGRQQVAGTKEARVSRDHCKSKAASNKGSLTRCAEDSNDM